MKNYKNEQKFVNVNNLIMKIINRLKKEFLFDDVFILLKNFNFTMTSSRTKNTMFTQLQ